jgi:hypothetical protein
MSAPVRSDLRRIVVYGSETKGIEAPAPAGELESRKYRLLFAKHKDGVRLQDFDGAILFQGTFESFKLVSNGYRSHLSHQWDRDELDRRTKEAVSLIEQGGFVCLLLTDPFIDFDDRRDFRETDLSKRLLSGFGVDRVRFNTRMTQVRSTVDDLAKFFTLYGAAWSLLTPRNLKDPDIKTLAKVDGNRVSVVVANSLLVIPTLLPGSTGGKIEEYFTVLADGVVSVWERLKANLPAWAAEYKFPDEPGLLDAKLRLEKEFTLTEDRLATLERLKRILVLQGEPLVDAVIEVFETMLPLKPKREEAFREDLVLQDSTGKAVALVEVKGVSKGVTREHVNQADSHRERGGMVPDFPSILIVNTAMKNSASVKEKDQPVAGEQIRHAANNNILVLRTLDLLNLVSLYATGTLNRDRVIDLLTKSRGWLRVDHHAAEVLMSAD